MKKSFFLLLIAGLSSLTAVSQNRFGIKTEITAILTPIYDISLGKIIIEPAKKLGYGIHAGVYFNINNDEIFFQPELLFESNVFEYDVTDYHDNKRVQQRINRLNIPLLFGVQFDIASIYFGPALAIKIESPKPLADVENFKKLFKKVSSEYQVGFEFDLSEKLELELRYVAYFGENYEGIEELGSRLFTLNKSNAALMISLGYSF